MIIDVYCERTGAELLAEPLNAVSNISFIIAAWAAWRLARRTGKLTVNNKLLIWLGFAVGIGSVLWHTYPTTATLILDVAPILVFIIWFIWLYLRESLGLGTLYAVGTAALFLTTTLVGMSHGEVLHGALSYAPGLLIVLALGIYRAIESCTERSILLFTAGVYSTALLFRTIDQEVCQFLMIGTHFIWHSLIGVVTYLAMRAVLSEQQDHESYSSHRKHGVSARVSR